MASSKHRRRRHQTGGSFLPPEPPEQPAPAVETHTTYGEPQAVAPEKPAYTQRQASLDLDRVGDILRRVREQRGEYLEEIADYLRIRPAYLTALENSHYEELPADAYVIGFLRTYANYLGLDGRAAIDQYRREMAGRRRKPNLTMPQPITEGQAPTPSVLIGAVIAIFLIYAVWYGLSGSDHVTEDLPPPVIQTTISETPAAPISDPPPLVLGTSTPSLTTTTGGMDIPATASSSIELSTPSTAANITVDTKVNVKNETKEVPKADVKPVDTPTPAEVKTKVDAKTVPAETQPVKDQDKTQPKEEKKTSKPPLIVRAEKESWVLITDDKGRTIFDRVLREGEAVKVPDQDNLKMTTGNAGGLVLNFDGVDLPPLGEEAKVLRGIDLNPYKSRSN